MDFIIYPSLYNISDITKKISCNDNRFQLQSTFRFTIIIIFQLLKNGLQVLVRYVLLIIKYSMIQEFIKRVFAALLNTGRDFFSKSDYGKPINSFTRELGVVSEKGPYELLHLQEPCIS